jgi:class 3 adenylate cyclase
MYRRVSLEIEQRQQAEAILRAEQEKSERLLLNILPEPIARQLKEGRSSIANGFAEATILFADLVNFTQLSARKSPTQLVELLNEIFSAFDRLTEQHGLEKIKTIGDAYMVVGGLPIPRHDHAQAVAEMALDMQREVARLSREQGETFKIRIGINTGPVVAGVIGTKKFIYDLWGDAVNTASRMESQGVAGAIQVTESTYERLQDSYLFEERGVIQVKGKGEMTTYFLLSKKVEHLVS